MSHPGQSRTSRTYWSMLRDFYEFFTTFSVCSLVLLCFILLNGLWNFSGNRIHINRSLRWMSDPQNDFFAPGMLDLIGRTYGHTLIGKPRTNCWWYLTGTHFWDVGKKSAPHESRFFFKNPHRRSKNNWTNSRNASSWESQGVLWGSSPWILIMNPNDFEHPVTVSWSVYPSMHGDICPVHIKCQKSCLWCA